MILITGIPNAGKTTYSQKYDNVIHFDEVKGGRHRRDKVIESVKDDNILVVEGVYEKAKDRKALIDASNTHNTCIWIDTPLDVCLDREGKYRHRGKHLVIWADEAYEPPTLSEGWDEIIIIRGEHEQRIVNKEKLVN